MAVVVVLSTVAPAVGTAQRETPSLSVSVSASGEATVGSSVSIEGTISVPDIAGDHSGDMTVTLYVDGSRVDSKTVTVADGDSTSVSFSHTFSETGSHKVRVEASVSLGRQSLSGSGSTTVSVEGEPLGSLDLSVDAPASVSVGGSASIDATVSLPDAAGVDASGQITITASAAGETKASQSVTLSDGGSESVTLSPTFEASGEVSVRIEASGTINGESLSVSETVSISVEGGTVGELSLSVDAPSTVGVGRSASVDATVSLPDVAGKSVSGDVSLSLSVDGNQKTSASVKLSDGDSETVTLTPSFETTGEVTVTVKASATIGGKSLSASETATVTVEGEAVGNLELSLDVPETTTAGESTPIDATVSLPDAKGVQASGDLTIAVAVDGNQKTSASVKLSNGDSETVTLTPSFETTGEVTVTVTATGSVGGARVSASGTATLTVDARGPSPSLSIGGRLPSNATKGQPVEIPVRLTTPDLPGSATAEVVVRVIAEGETVAQERVSVSDGESTNVSLSAAINQSGETTVRVQAVGQLAEKEVTATLSGTVMVYLPNRTTVKGAAFPVPASLQDEVDAYRQRVSLDDIGAHAFVVAKRDGLYLVFTDQEPKKGIATASGPHLDRSLSSGNLTFGVIAATSVQFDRKGQPVSVREVAENSAEYRLELVRVEATYRRVSLLTDPDAGADVTVSTMTGLLVENPRTAAGLLERVGAAARQLVRNPTNSTVDELLADPRKPHLHTASLETTFWVDAEATVDAIVLDPGSAARSFLQRFDAASVAHAERGEPILYPVREEFGAREFDSVQAIKRQGSELDGEVVSVEARLYQGRLSVQEAIEHAQGEPCSEDVLTIETPEGPVCINIVADVLLHGGVAWTSVPTSREDALLVVGISSRHQDQPTDIKTGRYRIVGEVVATSRIDASLPEGSMLVVYRLERVGDIDYDEVAREAKRIIENRSDWLVDRLRSQINGTAKVNGSAEGTFSVSVGNLSAEASATVEMSAQIEASTGVRSVTITAAAAVERARLRVRRLSKLPASVDAPPSAPHRILQLSVDGMSDEAVDRATIRLTVPTAAIGDGERPVVYRYHEGAWQPLETSVASRTDASLVVEATTTGFSLFAVGTTEEALSTPTTTATATETGTATGTATATVTGTSSPSSDTPTTTTVQTPAQTTDRTGTSGDGDKAQDSGNASGTESDGGSASQPGFGVVVGLIALLAGIAARRRRR